MSILGESTRANQNSPLLKSTKNAQMKENQVVIDCVEVGCDEDDFGEPRAAIFAETQELTARNVNPMKLIMLLRTRFGIGRYEIQRMRNVYNIRTPRRLSESELAGCRWD